MGYVTLGVLVLTGVALLFGTLFGLIRGSRRAFLRLILVIISAVGAILLRGVLVNFVINLHIGEDGTLQETLVSAFSTGDTQLPESITNLVMTLVELIIGLVSFILIFIVLRLLSWIILFPILKIFVKKGEKKRKGLGALFGLIQGIIIAIVTWSPVTGLVTQVDKIAKMELDGKPVIEIPADIGISEYVGSAPHTVYSFLGGWLYDYLSSGVNEEGNTVTIDDTVDVVVTLSGIANNFMDVSTSMETMTSDEASAQDKVDAMKNAGDNLILIGNQMDELSNDAKTTLNDLVSAVKDMMGSGEESDELSGILENLDLNEINFTTAGEALNGIASYIEKTDLELTENGEITQNEVDAIINGLADNSIMIDVIKGEGEAPTILPVEDEHKDMFLSAINETELTEEEKTTLRKIFGLE